MIASLRCAEVRRRSRDKGAKPDLGGICRERGGVPNTSPDLCMTVLIVRMVQCEASNWYTPSPFHLSQHSERSVLVHAGLRYRFDSIDIFQVSDFWFTDEVQDVLG